MITKNLVSTKKYFDRNGEEKKSYTKIGVIFMHDDGGISIKIEAMPINWDGTANAYEIDNSKGKQNDNNNSSNNDNDNNQMDYNNNHQDNRNNYQNNDNNRNRNNNHQGDDRMGQQGINYER